MWSALIVFVLQSILQSCVSGDGTYECGDHGRFEYCIDEIPGCVIGCHCHPGYYFDTDTKICEPKYEPCFAGCAAVTCDNPRERLRPCYPFCEPGCICIQPYVRDDRTHKCVLPEECTKGLKGIPDLGEDA